MNFFSQFFVTIFLQPLYNLLVFFVWLLPGNSLGGAIILLTFLVRLLLYPLQQKTVFLQLKLQEIQPKLKEIQKKFKNDKIKQIEELQKVYKEHNFNPASNLLIWIVQLPILFALFRVLTQSLNSFNNHLLYSFVPPPPSLNTDFLGINLKEPSFVLVLFLIFVQFLQIKFLSKNQKLNQLAFTFGISVAFGLILLRFPSALVLYILVSSLLGFLQQEFTKKKYERHRAQK